MQWLETLRCKEIIADICSTRCFKVEKEYYNGKWEPLFKNGLLMWTLKANMSLFITTKQWKGSGDKTPGVFSLGINLRRITEKERKLGSVYQTVDVNDI